MPRLTSPSSNPQRRWPAAVVFVIGSVITAWLFSQGHLHWAPILGTLVATALTYALTQDTGAKRPYDPDEQAEAVRHALGAGGGPKNPSQEDFVYRGRPTPKNRRERVRDAERTQR